MAAKRGSFNVILYSRKGRTGLVRRIPLSTAIAKSEAHSALDPWNYASVRRIPDGKLIGECIRGQFRFAS